MWPVTYASYVKCDRFRLRFFLHLSLPPSILPSIINPLHKQYAQVFSGMLVAMYILRQQMSIAVLFVKVEL